MSFDALIANPGRLSILTALAVEPEVEFVRLRRVTQLTDGNLSCHAKRLASAGLVDIDKSFRQGKPVTSMKLTPQGRMALESHVRRLLSAMSHRRLETGPAEPAAQPVALAVEDELPAEGSGAGERNGLTENPLGSLIWRR